MLIDYLVDLGYEAPAYRTGRDDFVEGDDDAVR